MGNILEVSVLEDLVKNSKTFTKTEDGQFLISLRSSLNKMTKNFLNKEDDPRNGGGVRKVIYLVLEMVISKNKDVSKKMAVRVPMPTLSLGCVNFGPLWTSKKFDTEFVHEKLGRDL